MNLESAPISLRRLQTSVVVAILLAAVGLATESVLLQRAYSGAPTVRVDDRSSEFALPELGSPNAAIDESVTGAVLAKPLFLPGRGLLPPAPADAPAPEPSPPEVTFRLMGVQISNGLRVAILQLDNSATALRAVEGQPVGDWILSRIYPDHVDLARGSRLRSIYLGDSQPRPDSDPPSE
jgi:hypothetical protein